MQVPNRTVHANLKARLDDWEDNPPKWQHQAYGPLNAYFTTIFPSAYFLVKPQSLLREEAGGVTQDPTYNPEEDEGDEGDDDLEEGDLDEDELDMIVGSNDRVGSGGRVLRPGQRLRSVSGSDMNISSDGSVDSRGAVVNDTRSYPDFCIDEYWEPKYPKKDVVRVVIEVGSLRDGSIRNGVPKGKVKEQLLGYMHLVGEARWEGWLLGLGIWGNEVFIAQMVQNDATPQDDIRTASAVFNNNESEDGWIKMSDTRFHDKLEEMYWYSVEHRT